MRNIFKATTVQEEIDAYLSSLEDVSEDVKQTLYEFKACANIINTSKNPQAVIDFIAKYYDNGLLAPLDINEDEFYYDGDINYKHKRCDDIYLNPDDDIIYDNAWKPIIKHVYLIEDKKEVPIVPDFLQLPSHKGLPIYITRGGVCKGEYISTIKLKKSSIANGKYTPHPPINIPCSLEIGCNFVRWSVDAREPKLKALRSFYDTVETKLYDYTFDIRKYTKLNKNG